MPTQLFVTHCKSDESLRGDNGFTIRASSPCDAAVQNWARSLAAFKLPVKMDSRSATEELPRRLALANGANGNRVLIHSLAVAFDSTGTRTGNYFSHAIIAPASSLDLKTALKAWGAGDWTLNAPPGFPTQLPERPSTPQGSLIHDEALREFLSNAPGPSRDEPLSRVVFPKRLNDPQKRRLLTRQFLQGVWMCNPALQTANRKRLLVHAEPGLAALLAYAAARLLPARLTNPLTFSLYESFANDLAYYKEGTIVGTYDPDQTLQPAKYSAYGFALDTIHLAVSPELRDPNPALSFLDVLIQTAGQPDGMARINRLHEKFADPLLARSPSAELPAIWRLAMDLEERFSRFENGQDSREDHKQLKKHGFGAMLREPQYRSALVRAANNYKDDDEIASDYPDIYKSELRGDLIRQAADAASAGDKGAWDKSWTLAVKRLASHESERGKLLETVVQELPPNANLPIANRCAILNEWLRSPSLGPSAKPPDRLVAASNLSQLQTLARDVNGLPPQWLACTAFSLLPHVNNTEVSKLYEAAQPALAPLVQLIIKSSERRALIAHSLPAGQKTTPSLFGALYDAGLRALPPDALAMAILDAGGMEPNWDEFWLAFPTQRAAGVLAAFTGASNADALIQRLAKRFTEMATAQSVAGSRDERTRLMVLTELAQKLSDPRFDDFKTRMKKLESLQYILSGEEVESQFPFPTFAKAIGVPSWRELIGARLASLQNDGLLNEETLVRHAKAIRNIYAHDHERGFEPWLDATAKLRPEVRDTAHIAFLNLAGSFDARRKLVYNHQKRLSNAVIDRYRPQVSSQGQHQTQNQGPASAFGPGPRSQTAAARPSALSRMALPAVIGLSLAVVFLAVGLAASATRNRDLRNKNAELLAKLDPPSKSNTGGAASSFKPQGSSAPSSSAANDPKKTGAVNEVKQTPSPPAPAVADGQDPLDNDAHPTPAASLGAKSIVYENLALPSEDALTMHFIGSSKQDQQAPTWLRIFFNTKIYDFAIEKPQEPPRFSKDRKPNGLIDILPSKSNESTLYYYQNSIFINTTEDICTQGETEAGAARIDCAASDPTGEIVAFSGVLPSPNPKPADYKSKSYMAIKKRVTGQPKYQPLIFENFDFAVTAVGVSPSKAVWALRIDNTFWRYDHESGASIPTPSVWDGWRFDPSSEANMQANPILEIIPLRRSVLFLRRQNGAQCWIANREASKNKGQPDEARLLTKITDLPDTSAITVTPAIVSPPLLVVGAKDGAIVAYKIGGRYPDANDFKQPHLSIGSHPGVNRLLFSWDGQWLAALGGGKLSVWRFSKGAAPAVAVPTTGTDESAKSSPPLEPPSDAAKTKKADANPKPSGGAKPDAAKKASS